MEVRVWMPSESREGTGFSSVATGNCKTAWDLCKNNMLYSETSLQP